MDELHRSTSDSATAFDQFDLALRNERDGVREFLGAKQRQLEEVETQLLGYFDQLAREASRGRHAPRAAGEEMQRHTALLARETENLAQLRVELESHHAEWRQIAEQIAQRQEAALEALRQELAEAKLRGAPSPETVDEGELRTDGDVELRRRYEFALDDLRELKRAKAQLEARLKEASDARPGVPPALPSDGPLNWETEKQRILAELESEVDEEDEDEDGRRNRVEVERIVRRTERIVADRDAEIAELKQLLDNQSTSVGSLAVGAAALGDMLDKDAIIQEERQNLAILQGQWREKLREAEVEMSVERAKLARQRTEVEEKLRLLEERAASTRDALGGTPAAEKPPRNRWLTRLKLKDPESGD